MKDIIVKDFSTNSTLIKIDDSCDESNISIDRVSVSDSTIDTLIESEILHLNVKDLTVENTSSAHGSPLINVKRGNVNFDNLKVYNYNGCADNDNGCINDQNEIIYDRKAVMFEVGEACDLYITNSFIGFVEMNSLLNYGINSNVYIDNTDIKGSRFINGVISCTDAKPYRIGNVQIRNSRINSIYNEYGTIMQVLTVDQPPTNKILFDNVSIENCGAQKYGGILLSFSNYTSNIVSFKDCTFKDISAIKGVISYIQDKNSDANFNNRDELIEYYGDNAFAINNDNLKLKKLFKKPEPLPVEIQTELVTTIIITATETNFYFEVETSTPTNSEFPTSPSENTTLSDPLLDNDNQSGAIKLDPKISFIINITLLFIIILSLLY
ncbi:hypothetical protein BCR36DRAFT_370235 [Piromyces finnis]|uniref:Right handed beta helix domain-containing protein n=1 Tax=Piromyces finnis TaxID=1754191 RepID=A0A1Y1V9U4_9FUNG|nr:hypothetical protein BCR36DRAFT_370235 [Piromyces finnis]|eukprot:ORX50749.1 hypothetical protein BCR36DRAFT_370235 [Piromyces finnis]